MSAQNYKLNKRVRSEKYSETLIGRCTKNNYKCIATLYIAVVNSFNSIYRYFWNKRGCCFSRLKQTMVW